MAGLGTATNGQQTIDGLALPALDVATRAICQDVADRLEQDAAALATAMATAVFREVPVYQAVKDNEDVQRTVLAHSLDHVRAVARTIRTWMLPSGDELNFVRAQAALRATQQVPLSALLHSYRLGHRTVWECLVQLTGDRLDAVLALTTLTLSYTNVISAALAEGYVERQRRLLLEGDRDRRDLLENLLLGEVGQRPETLRLAETFDLAPAADFIVAVMASSTPVTELTSEALTRCADTIRRHLSVALTQPFAVVRHHEIVCVAPLARVRASALGLLIRAAHTELGRRGDRWAVGVSTVCAGLADVPRGYEEAHHALEAAAPEARVMALLDMRVGDYLVHRADATAVRMIPSAGRRLLESTLPAERALIDTLLAYAEADMSVRLAADRLAVHPNTVTYRLRKLGRLIRRDPTRFSELMEVLTWARMVRSIGPS